MMITDVQIEYAEITQDEGEELLYQVYELLLSEPEVEQIEQIHAPEMRYN